MARGDVVNIAREAQTADQNFLGIETGASSEIQEAVITIPLIYTRETIRKVTIDDTVTGKVIAPADSDRVFLRFLNSFASSKVVYWKSMGQGAGAPPAALTVANGASLWGREWISEQITQSEYRGICSSGETEVVEVWEIFLK